MVGIFCKQLLNFNLKNIIKYIISPSPFLSTLKQLHFPSWPRNAFLILSLSHTLKKAVLFAYIQWHVALLEFYSKGVKFSIKA